MLLFWEQTSAGIKTFACRFYRLDYDPNDPTRKPGEPRTERGEIRYAAPDKAMFKVDGPMGEHWATDGKAIYELDPYKRKMVIHKLPPQLQGKAVSDGVLPLLFGTKAAELKRRYYLRLTTPPGAHGEVWLEAWPRFAADAQQFKQAEVILAVGQSRLTPKAVQLHHPNANSRVVYLLEAIAINKHGPLAFLEGDPFRPKAPPGWETVIEEPPEPAGNGQEPVGRLGPASVGTRSLNPR